MCNITVQSFHVHLIVQYGQYCFLVTTIHYHQMLPIELLKPACTLHGDVQIKDHLLQHDIARVMGDQSRALGYTCVEHIQIMCPHESLGTG